MIKVSYDEMNASESSYYSFNGGELVINDVDFLVSFYNKHWEYAKENRVKIEMSIHDEVSFDCDSDTDIFILVGLSPNDVVIKIYNSYDCDDWAEVIFDIETKEFRAYL